MSFYTDKCEFNAIQSLHQHLASGDILKVLHGPTDEAVDVRHKGFSQWREAILHFGRNNWIRFSVDEVIALQVLQFGRKHLL